MYVKREGWDKKGVPTPAPVPTANATGTRTGWCTSTGHEDTNIWNGQKWKAGGGRGVEKTYVANEKLGASVFEGNVTTIWGYGRGGLLNTGVYLFTSGWMGWEGRGRIGWKCGNNGRGGAWGWLDDILRG
jgi:hypothetical protein